LGSEVFAGVASLADLAIRARELSIGQFPDQVWQGAALARRIDAAIYTELTRDLDAPDFDDFLAELMVQRVEGPGAAAQLRPSDREKFYQRWPDSPQWKALAQQLLNLLSPAADPLDRLTLEAVASPESAVSTFESLYDAADLAFDLARCESLLKVLRERNLLLSVGLRSALAEREQYLATRVQFLEDFYRTVSYLDRGETLRNLRDFLGTPFLGRRLRLRKSWMLNIYGKGGSGKSMFLRWAISRHLVPAQSKMRVAVARLDIDYLNRSLLLQQPWLALLSLAVQLNSQLPGLPFSTLMGPDDVKLRNWLHNRSPVMSSDELERLRGVGKTWEFGIKDKFSRGLRDTRAIVFLDTVEELSVHYPLVLERMVRLFAEVRQQSTGLLVVFSGRYPIFAPERKFRDATAAEWAQWKSDCGEMEIGAFEPAESRRYLTELRLLNPQQPIEEIVKVSRGNPFILALFADLASGRVLAAEEVLQSRVQFEYLIERIIDRIPDEDVEPGDDADVQKQKRIQRALRWMLRYIVVRRELTKEFAEGVLAGFLFDELLGRKNLDDANNLAIAGKRYENTRRWHKLDAPVDFKDIWAALESYASASSWISGSGDLLKPQPEIVVPMRQLLTQAPEKYPIFPRLHRAAAEHFEKQAQGAFSPAAMLSEALYHRFQGEGQGASQWWDVYLKRCRESAAGPAAVQDLADSLFSDDYRDENRQPLLLHFGSSSIIDTKTLSAAALEAVMAGLIRSLREPDVQNEIVRDGMKQRLDDLLFYGCDMSDPRVDLVLAGCPLLGIEHVLGRSAPLPVPAELNDRDEQVAAALLAAAGSGYAEALRLASEWPARNFPQRFVRELAARADLAAGRVEEAFAGFEWSLNDALVTIAGESQRLMEELAETGYALGEWKKVDEFAVRTAASFPSALRWRFRLAIESFRYGAVTQSMALRSAALTDETADLAGATFNFGAAQEGYDRARALYQQGHDARGDSRTALKCANYLLDHFGSPARARQVAGPLLETRVFADARIELDTWLLGVRLAARRGAVEDARALYGSALEVAEKSPIVPRTYKSLVMATLLAEGIATEPDVDAFLREVERWPAPARAWAMRPFLYGQLDARSPTRATLPAMAGDVPAPYIAAAMIFFGQESMAAEVLESALTPLSIERDADLMAVCYRVAGRIRSGRITPGPDWVPAWLASGAIQPGYAAVVLLEEAERRFASGNLAAAWDVLNKTQPFRSALDEDSQWAPRFARLENALDDRLPDLVSLSRNLAAVPLPVLLTPAALVTVEVKPELLELSLELEAHLPGQDARASTRRAGPGNVLVRAARKGGLYPDAYAKAVNEKSGGGLSSWLKRIANFLTTGDPGPLGVELVRRQLSEFWPRSTMRLPGGTGVNCSSPMLNAVPWELIAGEAMGPRFFRMQSEAPLPDTLRYLRRAIEAIGLPPGTPGTWQAFVSHLGGQQRFREEIVKRLAETGKRNVLIIAASAERQRLEQHTYSARGLDLQRMYSRFQLATTHLPLEAEWTQEIRPFSVVHIVAPVGETVSPREAFLSRGEGTNPLRAEALTGMFNRWASAEKEPNRLRPFVIFEVAENLSDPGRTLLLRNSFASRIFIEGTRGVLAIGPYGAAAQAAQIALLVERIAGANMPIGDLHAWFLGQADHPHPALFMPDPDLPLWD